MDRKAQTQAVTAVLITGITVGAIASVYVWGTPILTKRQGQANIQQVQDQVVTLYEDIVSTSRGGKGTASNIQLDFSNQNANIEYVYVNPSEDYINLTLSSVQNSPYPTNTWTMVKGESLQDISIGAGLYGIKGEELPGVVMVRPHGASATGKLTYRIEFRNLYVDTASGEKLEKIDLQAQGGNVAAGATTVRISNDGIRRDSGSSGVQLPSGERIDRDRTVIKVDLR
ncbi:MAG: hypothetical protein ABEJ69_01750 [Candidatus Nanohaloarchaea archaeon]